MHQFDVVRIAIGGRKNLHVKGGSGHIDGGNPLIGMSRHERPDEHAEIR